MPELNDEQQRRLAALLDIDPARLAAIAAQVDPDSAAGLNGGDLGDGNAKSEDPELDALLAEIDGMSDEELAALEAEMEAEEAGAAEPEAEPAAAGLSNDAAMALELAQATGDENARQLSVIQAQLDAERWEGEKRKLVAAGTPPYIADLAQPLLEGGGHVVDLANGKSVDAGQIMRKVLAEYAKVTQTLDFGAELGTPVDEPDSGAETERDEIVNRAKAQLFGIRG
jgi:hypothetical protein